MKTYEMPSITLIPLRVADIVAASDSFDIPISTDPMDGSDAL